MMNSSRLTNEGKTFLRGCINYTLSDDTFHHSTLARSCLTIVILINVLSCPLIVVLNALVMVAVKMKNRLRAQKSNILLAALASTDIMIGLLVQPVFIAKLLIVLLAPTPQESRKICLLLTITKAGISCLSKNSVLHIALLSGERLLAIRHPFTHSSSVTTSRLLLASGSAWLVTIILQIIIAFSKMIFIFISNVLICLTIIFITFCHVELFRETRRLEQRISAHQVSQMERKRFQEGKKAFKLTVITVTLLILSHLPFLVCRLVLFWYASKLPTEYVRIIGDSSISAVLFNSLLNPVIYSIRMKQFRGAFRELLCGIVNKVGSWCGEN